MLFRSVVNERRVNFGNFDRAALGNTEYAQLTGTFAVDDEIVVTGFAEDPVVYRVQFNDMLVRTGNKFRFGTPDEVRVNVAASLANLLRSATTASAVVGVWATTLSFTGEAGRAPLQIRIDRALDADGNPIGSSGVELARANTYREAMGAVQIGEPGTTTTWVDAQAPRADARFTALDTYAAGQSLFAAAGDPASGGWQSGAPGLFLGTITPNAKAPAVITSLVPNKGSSPPGQGVDSLIDGNNDTSYLNLAGPGSGFVMSLDTPQADRKSTRLNSSHT